MAEISAVASAFTIVALAYRLSRYISRVANEARDIKEASGTISKKVVQWDEVLRAVHLSLKGRKKQRRFKPLSEDEEQIWLAVGNALERCQQTMKKFEEEIARLGDREKYGWLRRGLIVINSIEDEPKTIQLKKDMKADIASLSVLLPCFQPFEHEERLTLLRAGNTITNKYLPSIVEAIEKGEIRLGKLLQQNVLQGTRDDSSATQTVIGRGERYAHESLDLKTMKECLGAAVSFRDKLSRAGSVIGQSSGDMSQQDGSLGVRYDLSQGVVGKRSNTESETDNSDESDGGGIPLYTPSPPSHAWTRHEVTGSTGNAGESTEHFPHNHDDTVPPEAIMNALIDNFKDNARNDFINEHYYSAERHLLDAIEYGKKRLEIYNFPFNEIVELREQLAEAYTKQEKFSEAEQEYLCLIGESRKSSSRYGRLCCALATAYQKKYYAGNEKDYKLFEVWEDYSMRSLHVALDSPRQGNTLLQRSAKLLVDLYEKQNKPAFAKPYRELYLTTPRATYSPVHPISPTSFVNQGPPAAGGGAGAEDRGPVRFNHAVSYVNKIKNRFASQPDIYKQLLPESAAQHRAQQQAARHQEDEVMLSTRLSKPEFSNGERGVEDDTNETRSTVVTSTFDYTTQSDSTRITPFSTAHRAGLPGSSKQEKALLDQAELKQISANRNEQDNEAYSEAGSITDYEEIYANALRSELLQDLKSIDLTDVEPLLSLLLEEFAIRIGHQGESRDHQNMMYIAHKHRRNIARDTCGRQPAQEDDVSIDGSAQSEETATSGGSADDPAYYSDMQNIEDWNKKNESEIPDTYAAEADPWEDKLSFGHEALRKSEAYKWLISAVQRNVNMNGVQPSCMEGHRQWLLTMLETNTPREQALKHQKISRCRRPALYTAKFELSWNLMGFLREQEYADEDLHAIVGRVITLSGDHQFVQALPCKEYMEQIWPSTGADFVRLLERLVETPAQPHEYILSDKTKILAELHGDSVFFEVTGTTYGLAEVVEQLFWVSTALQTPTDAPGASLNFAEASATFVVDETVQLGSKGGVTLAEHIGTAHCKVRFKSKFLDQKAQLARGHCWHNLFQHCAIVSGYPIPSRPSQRPGLEVPFDMLAALACAERVTPFCGNLVAKGFSTLLFVTCHEDRCMFWHLVYNKDGSRVSFTDDRVFLPAEMESTAMQLRPDDIDDARHIVGWTAKLKKNTGVIDAKYNIGWSALRSPSCGFALEKVQICAGKYVTVGGTFARGKREKAVHIKDQDDYVARLKSIGDKFIVLHDIEVRKAWLVDGVSALLHLIRANLTYDHHQDDYGAACLLKPEALQAKGESSGRKMAFETLRDSGNMKLRLYRKASTVHEEGKAEVDADFYCLVDAAKYIMHILEQIVDHQADERAESSVGYRIRTSPWTQLEGFDFMDIAIKSDLIWPRVTTLHADGEGWVGLTRAIYATTLFGKGFGELLEPVRGSGDRNHCVKCCWNSNVPKDRDVLAVSISELERIVERRGSKADTYWRLVENFYLDFPPELFSACSRNEHRGCHQQRVQKIRRSANHNHEEKSEEQKKEPRLLSRLISRISRRRDKTTSAGEDAASLDIPAGGLLLGMTLKRPKKNAQESKDAKKPVLTRGKGLSGPRPPASFEVGSLQVVSASSSSNITTQDTSTTIQPNSESTSLTEPSRLPGATVTSREGKGKLKDSTI